MDLFERRIKKQHRFHDFLYWNLLLAVPLVTACIGIANHSLAGLTAFLLLVVMMAGVIYRFFCTHCPHYIQGEKATRCMFFWGMPKFFTEKPGPLNRKEKAISIAAPLVMLSFPLPWLMDQPGLMLIYLMSLAVTGWTMWRQECVRCAYTDCPANRVEAAADDTAE